MRSLRIVALSDTHGLHRQVDVPPGDILIHAGDITRHGEMAELSEINEWLGSLPHRHKVVIAGNHDWCFEQPGRIAATLLYNAIYLQDEAVTLEGIAFYGSPWTPQFFDWAFNLPRGEPLAAKWAQIPTGTDILVTHGPPRYHGDYTIHSVRAGCADLLEAVTRLQPCHHVFGHIHEGAGITTSGGTTFINASVVNVRYEPINPPVLFELAPSSG
jgi:Icc-related predicted phosphoesterase